MAKISNNQPKHVHKRYYFVRKLFEDGKVKIEFVRSENNDSNTFKKLRKGTIYKTQQKIHENRHKEEKLQLQISEFSCFV